MISKILLVLPRSILRPVEAGITMAIGGSTALERKYDNLNDFPLWV
jgi:hypothetical protein